MSLHPQPISPVSAETALVAHAAFPRGNVLIRMRGDELGTVYEDAAFAHLFPSRGKPAQAPWRLALVTNFQFAQNLSDRRPADAVRGLIGWKYAISLELDDAGFDHPVLCELRTRLLEGGSGQLLPDSLLTRFGWLGLLKARGKQRVDSRHVLAKVRALNGLDFGRVTMRHALAQSPRLAEGILRPAVGRALRPVLPARPPADEEGGAQRPRRVIRP